VNVLLVEDDRSVGDFIVAELRAAGHSCVHKTDGEDGLSAARNEAYDVMVIDRMLPRLDGLSLVQQLRESGDNTPFSMAELLARLEVLQRRANSHSGDPATTLQVEDLVMDLLQQQVSRGAKPITLQPREYKLLEYLMRHAGQVVTRSMLLEHVWGYHFDPQTNVIDVHVSRLRQKIDRDFDEPLLTTVRGAGYRLGPGVDD
jgi:two-component system OmpR family response regulator